MPVAADLYYFQYSGGQPDDPAVVLLHGAGGTHLHWPPEVRRLSGFNLLAPDLPGHGKSPGPGEQSIPDYTRHAIDWLDALALTRAAFVGHSMGSAIAMTLALQHPSRVRALVLVGAGARLRVHPELLEAAGSALTFPNAVDTMVEWSYGPDVDPRFRELAAERLREIRPSVLHGDFLACDRFDEMESVEDIQAPALVISGSEDRLTPPRYAQYLARKIPRAELQIVPGAGHMTMLEQPKAVAALIRAFLDSLI